MLRTAVFIALALFCPFIAMPQGGNNSGNNEPVGFQPESWIKANNIMPPSPQAASLGEYGLEKNIDINYFTGTPTIRIPIYTASGNKLSAPITLSYNPNALKVGEVPSWTGLGWSLTAGGVISRTVQGYPDFGRNYFNLPNLEPDYADYIAGAVQENVETYEFYTKVVCGTYEIQPDIYNFSIPGYSGSFAILHDGSIVLNEYQDLKIEVYFTNAVLDSWAYDVERFVITDPLGTKYYFGKYGDKTAIEQMDFANPYVFNENNPYCSLSNEMLKYNSAFYLLKIVSAGGTESIEFEYLPVSGITGEAFYEIPRNYLQDNSMTCKLPGGFTLGLDCCNAPLEPMGNGSCSYSVGLDIPLKIFDRKYLREIRINTGGELVEYVRFSASQVTEDPLDPVSSGYKLDEIKVYRRWKSGTVPVLRYTFTYDPGHSTGRLTLESLQSHGYEGYTPGDFLPPWRFEYEGSLPSVFSNAIDHWGFYNGHYNTSLIPHVEVGCDVFGEGAYRNASFQPSGILKKISYPAGGFSTFEFEGHEIKDLPQYSEGLFKPLNGKVGGFRIKTIRDYNADGTLANTRHFQYKDQDGSSSGFLMKNLVYYQLITNFHYANVCGWGCQGCNQCEFFNYMCQSISVFASNQNPVPTNFPSHVGYARVEEIFGTPADNIGKIVYHFRKGNTSAYAMWDIESGTLERKEFFDKYGKLVKEEKYQYAWTDVQHPRSAFGWGAKIVSSNIQDNRTLLCELSNGTTTWMRPDENCQNGDCINGFTFKTKYERKPYLMNQRWKYMVSTSAIEYFPDGTVARETLYEYGDDKVALPTATSFVNSDGKVHRRETTYFHNDVGHIHAIPQVTLLKVDNEIAGGVSMEMDFFGRPLKFKDILPSGSELLRAQITSYNGYGKPVDFKVMAFPTEYFTWDNGLLVGRSKGGWTWEYDYNDKRLLTQYTDMDGQVTEYNYDGLMRLKTVLQRNGNVQTSYSYVLDAAYGGENSVTETISFSDYPSQITKSTFDGLGRALRTILVGYGPNGEDVLAEDLTYDSFGRVVRKVYEKGAGTYTIMRYDLSPLSRLIEEIYPDFRSKKYRYGASNNYYTIEEINENGQVTTTVKDLLERTISVTNPLGGITSYAYDARNNLVLVVNPEDQQYQYTYDLRNRLICKVVPGAAPQYYVYDDETDLQIGFQDGNMRAENKWLVTEYDIHGRKTREGFGFGGGGTNSQCGANPPALQITEDLVLYFYDTYHDMVPGCTAPSPASKILTGKLTQTNTRIIGSDGLEGWVKTSYCYDEYGRKTGTYVVSPYGEDFYEDELNFADLVLENRRSRNGQELVLRTLNEYDHAKRILQTRFGIGQNIAPQVLPVQTVGSYEYFPTDKVKRKVLGELAAFNYLYANPRGWLTHINQLTAGGEAKYPDCWPYQPNNPDEYSCTRCGGDALTLPEILGLRFDYNLRVDCFIPCDCAGACEDFPTQTSPTDTCTTVQMYFSGPESSFPIDVYKVRRCDGTVTYATDQHLQSMYGEDYRVAGRLRLETPDQYVRLKSSEGQDQVLSAKTFVGQLPLNNVEVKVPTTQTHTACNCTTDTLSCSAAEATAQEASIDAIVAQHWISSPDQLLYPTRLVRVRLCSGKEIYLFDEELAYLSGNYVMLQEIPIERPDQYLAVGQPAERIPLVDFLQTRTLEKSTIINYYTSCEANLCTTVDRQFFPEAINGSNYFPAWQTQTEDLTQIFPGAWYSLKKDNKSWTLDLPECDLGDILAGLDDPVATAEASWFIPLRVPLDVSIKYFEVQVYVADWYGIINDGEWRIALYDGQQFLSINSGLPWLSSDNSPTPVPGSVISLIPDQMPTPQQLGQMRVVLYLSTQFCPLHIEIDAVKAIADYTEPCSRCAQPVPNCSPEQGQMQIQALASILQNQSAWQSAADIPLPTWLYRVRLCNGQEVYLLEPELEQMPQPWTILQAIWITDPAQTLLTEVESAADNGLDDGEEKVRNDLFALKLRYYSRDPSILPDAHTGAPQRMYQNGNIGTIYWQVAGRDREAFAFTYDELDRLRVAAYGAIASGGVYYNLGAWRETIRAYDGIGNILALDRAGALTRCETGQSLQFGLIDSLTYQYNADKTRLTAIRDATGVELGFRASDPGQQYSFDYDANGNLTWDESKQAQILYNHLNLPTRVTTPQGVIEWKYDATGRKLEKTVTTNGQSRTTLYLDGVEIYPDGSIFAYHAEGRAALYGDSLTWQYEYVARDHLGNTRVCFADRNGNGRIELPGELPGQPEYTEILQENHYYPFGLELSGPWAPPQTQPDNPYRYNGKERNTDLGLDWYDYGARWYDPAIARWGQVDPLGDHPQQVDKSGFAYAWNNPVNLNDPDGQCPLCGVAWIDAVVDVGFVLYDVYKLIHDKVTTGKTKEEDWLALAADVGSIFVPMSVGAGMITRSAYKALGRAGANVERLSRALKAQRISKVVIREGVEGKGVIVIGENMKRVNTVAKELGAETFDVTEFYAKKYGVSFEEASKAIKEAGSDFWSKGGEGYRLNEEWIEQQLKEGKTIIDIGEDPARDKRSIFYAMEREKTKDYSKPAELILK